MELTATQLQKMLNAAADQAIDRLLQLQEKQKKDIQNRTTEHRIIKRKMESYRAHKRMIAESRTFSQEEAADLRFEFLQDLMGITGNENRTEELLLANDARIRRLEYEVFIIDKAVELFRQDVEQTTKEVKRDWLYCLEEYYMSPEERRYEDIAEELMIDDSTARKYVNKALYELLKYIV